MDTQIEERTELEVRVGPIDIDAVRRAYPNPVSSRGSHDKDAYCVLGAVNLYLGAPIRAHNGTPVLFPFYTAPRLGVSVRDAAPIMLANDRGDFESAWRLAGEALRGVK